MEQSFAWVAQPNNIQSVYCHEPGSRSFPIWCLPHLFNGLFVLGFFPRSKKATPGPLLDVQAELTSTTNGVNKATMGFSGHAHESLSKVERVADGDVTVFQLPHPPRPHHSTSTFVLTESL
jgi:hypothetical protein